MDPNQPLRLTTLERALLRYSIVLTSAVVLVGLVGLIVWALGQVVSFFYALLLPLLVAGVLALILYPVVCWIQRVTRWPRVTVVSVLFAAVLTVLAMVVVVVAPAASDQIRDFVDTAPELAENAYDSLSWRFPKATEFMADTISEMDLESLLPNVEGIGSRLLTYAGVVVGLGFVPLYLFFALLSGERLKDGARELLSIFSPQVQTDAMYLMRLFIGYITAFFQGQVVIALIMGVLLAIGFTIAGLEAAILFGLLLGMLNIVPYLGTIVGLLLALPVAYLQPGGGLLLVALVLSVFVVVQLIESWLLTPKIMADRSGLHPAIVVISIFFWGTALGGIIGMILAVPLSAFLVSLWKHAKEKWASAVVDTPDLQHSELDMSTDWRDANLHQGRDHRSD
ncbi:AI-2E family transporter [Thioalkalivibrio sp. ALJ7]|uniref:AI-2E family transporter n=1 Tax=Thioalkalivibrio sp. ALJ7 TaxID=1158756 RepID=UPI0003646EC0|nr:AI-2E family transporter [Thioalkalivibrio sp. ALJ7]